eukprot:2967597-Alexandrium_andersonii.AAC.1
MSSPASESARAVQQKGPVAGPGEPEHIPPLRFFVVPATFLMLEPSDHDVIAGFGISTSCTAEGAG